MKPQEAFPWQWFAGFVDGDGTIGIYVNRKTAEESTWGFSPILTVYNTYLPALKMIEEYLGGYLTETSYDPKTQKPCYSLGWKGDDARHYLKKILPHLVIKGAVAKVVLELPQREKGRSKAIAKRNRKILSQQLKSLSKVKSLNNRGKEK